MTRVAVLSVAILMAVALLVPAPASAAMGKTHDLKGLVVAVNVEGKTITLKDDAGTSMTYPVLDAAAGTLKTLKAGENVVATCQDNENGEHQGISRIQGAPPSGDQKKSSR